MNFVTCQILNIIYLTFKALFLANNKADIVLYIVPKKKIPLPEFKLLFMIFSKDKRKDSNTKRVVIIIFLAMVVKRN